MNRADEVAAEAGCSLTMWDVNWFITGFDDWGRSCSLTMWDVNGADFDSIPAFGGSCSLTMWDVNLIFITTTAGTIRLFFNYVGCK